MPLDIKISSPASPEEITVVEKGLQKFNEANSTEGEVKPLHVIANKKNGGVSGGAIGRTWGKCCELQELWVDAELRGKGVGTSLMRSFELEAEKRGCNLIYLSTFSFQSPAFYKKRGYKEVSRISGFSGGEEKIHMQKKINQ